LKNIWTAPLPPETELSRQMTTSTTSIDIMGLQAAYANLHTDQERDYFMQRYHDVISSFGGKTSYDADNRPLLVMRSNLWASRSEERFSRNAETDLVCRLLLEKKNAALALLPHLQELPFDHPDHGFHLMSHQPDGV